MNMTESKVRYEILRWQ